MTTAEDYFDKGKFCFITGQYGKAIEFLTEAIKLGKTDDYVYALRGNLCNRLGRYKEAIKDFDEVISYSTDEGIVLETYHNRGGIKNNLGQYENAIADYDEVIRIDPNFAVAYNGRGTAKWAIGQIQEALSDFNEAIKHSQEKDEFMVFQYQMYCNRGNVKSILGQKEEALEDLNIAIELNQYYPTSYVNRGNVKIALGKYQEAIKDCNAAIELTPNPDLALAFCNRGIANYYLQNYSEATQDWLTCTYLSVKQKYTRALSSFISYLEMYPQDILLLYRELGINVTRFLLNHYATAETKISNFALLIKFLTTRDDKENRNLLGIKAILNYHLGGPVSSFVIFDEELDNGDNVLTSQELYYYAQAAKDINVEPNIILQNAIQDLEERSNNEIDYYYLGQLYLMTGNRENAKLCFEKSINLPFSKIMLCSLGTKNIDIPSVINSLKSAKPNYEINAKEIKDLSQFQLFFHCFECQSILSKLAIPVQWYIDEPIFWKSFYLSNKSKEEIKPIVREFEANEILQKIQQYFTDELQEQVPNTEKNILSQKTETELYNKYDISTSEVFKWLKDMREEENAKLVIQIGKRIEEWKITLNPAYCYSLIIQYFYCTNDLSESDIFALYCYLLHTAAKKKHSNIKVDSLIIDISKTIASDVRIKLLITATNFIWNIIKENIKNLDTENDYVKFSKNLWKTIADDKEFLSPEEFDKKYYCFDWLKEKAT